MLPDWYNDTVNAVTPGAGATALDEWAFCEVLGQDRAKAALTDHFNNFVTEDDIQALYEHGINHLRIPTGFWAWIPTTGDEPYVNDQALYQGQIERILGCVLFFRALSSLADSRFLCSYAYERGMYAIIDAHGVPGSQNGEQSSGQLTPNACVLLRPPCSLSPLAPLPSFHR
jgi:glucan 1,3-beta-glucosidase